MSRPTVIDINCATGEQTERDMTDEEYALWLAGATETTPA